MNVEAKKFRDWLQIPLEPSEAGYLIFGRRPDGPLVVKILDDLAWADTYPGTGTYLAFAKLIERAVSGGKLRAVKDSDGKTLVAPQDVFRFAVEKGVDMETSVHAAWVGALAESAAATESEAHERSAHPSEIQMTTKEREKNIRAEWWISTDDGSLFFRTLTNEIEDGVAEFKGDTKSRKVMALLCERGQTGVSIVEIIEAAYPDELKILQDILRNAPHEDAKDARIEYFKNSDVLNIFKKAKQACWTVRNKLHTKGIPEEVIEILPGLETSILKNLSAPMAFLRVENLQMKSGNVVKMRPGIVGAPEVSEYTKNAASRPHL